MPANGETVTIVTKPSIPVDMSLGLLKKGRQIIGEYSGNKYCIYSNKRLGY